MFKVHLFDFNSDCILISEEMEHEAARDFANSLKTFYSSDNIIATANGFDVMSAYSSWKKAEITVRKQ